MEVWKVGKTFLIHSSRSMFWEMIVSSNVTCMKIEYIRLKHAIWVVWSFKCGPQALSLTHGVRHSKVLFLHRTQLQINVPASP
ncbi:hypothetical protein LDENG_00242370 [Lucifuga dentata]|nr:hypothetical protein LDENG_00242370 [Lucifuga dentata]